MGDTVVELVRSLLAVEPVPEAVMGIASAVNFGSSILCRWGRFALVEQAVQRAHAIGDPAMRRGFLEDLPENARTLALARQWLGAGDTAPD